MVRDWIAEKKMPFSAENQQWVRDEIHDEIRKALGALNPPTRAKRLLHSLRDLGLTAAIYAVPIGLLAAVVALSIALTNRAGTEATFRGKTDEKLSGIERQLIDLRALTASSQSSKSQNQDAAKALPAEARQKAIPPIPAPVIEQAGKSFIEASHDDPKAWGVALDFVSYRSSQNQEPPLDGYYPLHATDTPKVPISRFEPTIVYGANGRSLQRQKAGSMRLAQPAWNQSGNP